LLPFAPCGSAFHGSRLAVPTDDDVALVDARRGSWSSRVDVHRTGRDALLFSGIGFSPRTEAPQMRENMSLLSFWGLVFSLIAVTLFVVIYSYQKNKNANQNIVEDLRQRSVKIYLAAETHEAETDSKKFRAAADEIERLRAETSVLFWLIIAMNAAVIIIFTLAYRIL
jgi:hypothetical protein